MRKSAAVWCWADNGRPTGLRPAPVLPGRPMTGPSAYRRAAGPTPGALACPLTLAANPANRGSVHSACTGGKLRGLQGRFIGRQSKFSALYAFCVDWRQFYASSIPAAWQVARMSAGQMELWISPIWALRRRNMQRRDWPIPPPMVWGSLPSSRSRWK